MIKQLPTLAIISLILFSYSISGISAECTSKQKADMVKLGLSIEEIKLSCSSSSKTPYDKPVSKTIQTPDPEKFFWILGLGTANWDGDEVVRDPFYGSSDGWESTPISFEFGFKYFPSNLKPGNFGIGVSGYSGGLYSQSLGQSDEILLDLIMSSIDINYDITTLSGGTHVVLGLKSGTASRSITIGGNASKFGEEDTFGYSIQFISDRVNKGSGLYFGLETTNLKSSNISITSLHIGFMW